MIPGDTISVYLSIPITLLICILGYKSHSLSLDGSCCAFFVGILHFVAGWRYIFILAFFFFSSSKLTKLWNDKKKKAEDGYKYGGERRWHQVLANSLPSCVLCAIVIYLKYIKRIEDISHYEVVLFLPSVLAQYIESTSDTWSSEIGVLSQTPMLYFPFLTRPFSSNEYKDVSVQKDHPRTLKTVLSSFCYHFLCIPCPVCTNGGISLYGLVGACFSGLLNGLLYVFIQPEAYYSTAFILSFSLILALVGTLLDSFIGSIFEISFYCSKRQKIVKYHSIETEPCCKSAYEKKQYVYGHQPTECGMICGLMNCSGSFTNILCCSLVTLGTFVAIYFLIL